MALQISAAALGVVLRSNVLSLAKTCSIDGVDGSCSRRRIAL